MRRKLLASLVAVAAGGAAFGQMRPASGPPAMMPGGAYAGVQPVQHAGPAEPMPMGPGGPMPGGAPMSGAPMGDPSGGLMPGYGCPDAGITGGGSAPVPQWWVDVQYFLWFMSSQKTNQPYVTTSDPGSFGALGAPNTQVLWPEDGKLNNQLFSGFRIMGGWYRDADRRCGFEFGGFLSENKTLIYNASSDLNGIPTLSRTFNAAGGGTGVYVVANLGLASGAVTVANTSRYYGVEASIVNNLYRSCPGDGCFWNTDVLYGFRFFQLREDLNFDSSSTIINGGATFVGQPVAAGGTINVHDGFECWNQFYGGQIGIRSNINWGRSFLGLSAKCGFGMMHQTVDVTGSTNLVDNAQGINATASGGVYATSQNIGSYKNDEFAYIPEVGITFGYQWCSWLTSYVGYNGIYISDVVRPANAVPFATNPSLMPSSNNFGLGGVVPQANTTITQTDMWIQGATFGFLVRY